MRVFVRRQRARARITRLVVKPRKKLPPPRRRPPRGRPRGTSAPTPTSKTDVKPVEVPRLPERGARHDRRPERRPRRAPTRSAGSSTRRSRRGRTRATRCRTCAPSRRRRSSSCGTSTRSSRSTRTSTASTRAQPASDPKKRSEIDRWILSELEPARRRASRPTSTRTTSTARPGRSSTLRRRALELVRPPLARPLLARDGRDGRHGCRQARGVRDALRVPRHAGASDGAVHAVPVGGDLPEPRGEGARAARDRAESVHLTSFPEPNAALIDKTLSHTLTRGARRRQPRSPGAHAGRSSRCGSRSRSRR